MNSNIKTKENALDKAIAILNSKYKRNRKQKVHDEIRDYIIKNLDVIRTGLIFVEKELRVIGGYIDIVAKDKNSFYLIELKTTLSQYSIGAKEGIRQLLKQKKGLKHILSLFTNKKINIRLILLQYTRDTKKLLVKELDDSGKSKLVKKISISGD